MMGYQQLSRRSITRPGTTWLMTTQVPELAHRAGWRKGVDGPRAGDALYFLAVSGLWFISETC